MEYGPQGSTFGVLEYLSQSNDNADNVPPEDRFKFMDDLTILEIIRNILPRNFVANSLLDWT